MSRKRRSSRGTLSVISLLLLSSAAIRVAVNADTAMALVPDTHAEAEPEAVAGHAPEECAPPPEIAAVLAALQQREARVAADEEKAAARLKAMSLAETELERKLLALREAEEELRGTIALADEAAEGDLARLTAVYESMKPVDAAALFETMDPQFAAGFLGRMRPEAAAGIMAGLSSEVAYSVSVILAGRNALVPTR